MLELLIIVVFIWLLVKAAGLAFRLTWGIVKIAAGILIALALPGLFICLVFVGGIALIVPLALMGAALGLLKACV